MRSDDQVFSWKVGLQGVSLFTKLLFLTCMTLKLISDCCKSWGLKEDLPFPTTSLHSSLFLYSFSCKCWILTLLDHITVGFYRVWTVWDAHRWSNQTKNCSEGFELGFQYSTAWSCFAQRHRWPFRRTRI